MTQVGPSNSSFVTLVQLSRPLPLTSQTVIELSARLGMYATSLRIVIPYG